MAYVAQDDLILVSENEFSIIQGNSQTYKLNLHKDYVGAGLYAKQATEFHAALYVDGDRVIQYSYPPIPGVSGNLKVTVDGELEFTIDSTQSAFLPAGSIEVEVAVIYGNFYPQPKTYRFPRLHIGTAINNPNAPGDGGDNGGGDGSGDGGSGGGTPVQKPIGDISSKFTIEAVDGSMPTTAGFATLDSHAPSQVTEIVFKNLDSNEIRLVALENFLQKRITNEGINGVITISDMGDSNMYAIYKIEGWEREDLLVGGGKEQDSDGIKVYVDLEAISTGPGVTKSAWEVGQEITYQLDAHGITSAAVKPNGILTYTDKSINPQTTDKDQAPTGAFISYSPYQDSYVTVEINGISVEVGNGTKDTAAYFSGDMGVSATTIEEIRAGDQLYWNGSIAGYELEEGDQINLIYEAKAEDLR